MKLTKYIECNDNEVKVTIEFSLDEDSITIDSATDDAGNVLILTSNEQREMEIEAREKALCESRNTRTEKAVERSERRLERHDVICEWTGIDSLCA